MATITPVQAIIDEQQRREVRSTAVPIVTLNSKRGGKALAAGVPGTVHIILTRKGSGIIEKLRVTLDQDERRFAQVIEDIVAPFRRKKTPLSIDAMVKLTLRQPVFADLRSGGERLHSGVFVPPGADAICLAYPYNGGPLPSRGLELVQYLIDGTDRALEAIALKCDPVLTKAEAAALELMPKNQITKNVGASVDCETTYVALVAVTTALATLALALVTAGCGVIGDPHVDDSAIKQLGPGASARRLLEMRRNALKKATEKIGRKARKFV